MEELLLLQRLFMGGQGWLQVALLVCLFVVLVFRPERIYSRTLFRWSCLLLALSVIAPPLLALCLDMFDLLGFQSVGRRMSRSGGGWQSLLTWLANMSGPLLLAASIFLGLLSLGPAPQEQDRPAPPKHPME